MNIHLIDNQHIATQHFLKQYVGCAVLTKDNKLLLQQRGNDWDHYPGFIAEFGGRVELNETPMHALVRELNEELGAKVKESEVISFGALTEEYSNHDELIYVYFWHDKEGTITGCYEGEMAIFDNVNAALKKSNITDGLRWLLMECQKKNLIK